MNCSRAIIRDTFRGITKKQLLLCTVRVLHSSVLEYRKSVVLNEKIGDRPNVDTEDVARHAELLKDWWNEKGTMMPLHSMNKIRIQLIRNGLENSGKLKSENIKTNPKYLKGIKIMDVGCGAGILCEPLARLGADITGIDPGLEQIKVAKQHATEYAHTFDSSPPNYVHTTIEEHSARSPGVYDAVIASEVIEHVPDKTVFLEACLKTLKPGGSIFLTTPNKTTASWVCVIVVVEDILKMLPKGIHDWNNFISHADAQQLLAKLGCTTVSINGFVYNLLTNSWSWTTSTQLHYALHAVKNLK